MAATRQFPTEATPPLGASWADRGWRVDTVAWLSLGMAGFHLYSVLLFLEGGPCVARVPGYQVVFT